MSESSLSVAALLDNWETGFSVRFRNYPHMTAFLKVFSWTASRSLRTCLTYLKPTETRDKWSWDDGEPIKAAHSPRIHGLRKGKFRLSRFICRWADRYKTRPAGQLRVEPHQLATAASATHSFDFAFDCRLLVTELLGTTRVAAAFFVVISLLYVAVRRRRIRRLANPHNLPYPPGPKPLPIVGNMFDIARNNEVAAYQQLAKQYGDLVFLSTLGKHVLFVNSFETAKDLFEKRSINYSDRNQSPMSHDLMGWDFSFGHMPYGDRWKAHRRMFHRQFQQSVAPIYWPVQKAEAHALLRRLLHSSENLVYHLRHNAAAVIMGVTYGITVASTEDRYIAIAEKALEGMGKAASPGAFLVDLLPIRSETRPWVPGASFKRKAHEWRDAVMEMRDAPFATVLNDMKNGQAPPSFVSNLLNDIENKENIQEELDTIRNCAGLAYAAGAESTVSTLTSFVLAILVRPEVQAKAQKELDSVVGLDRLPEFSDRPALPYTTAILKEVLRWNPVAPLGLPHMVTHDDEYNGYFIPAGTTIVGNSWGILHDPRVFPDPHVFNPDRFMGRDNNQHFSPSDPLSAAFGYGRRVCPGRYMAEAQVWISIASILSAFDISPAHDEFGRPIEVVPAFSSGMICHPLPFKFSMKPRSEMARSLIEQTEFHS